MTRPILERAAADIAGQDADAAALLDIIMLLLPLLQLCAGPNVAGWLAGDPPRVLSRKASVDVRKNLIWFHLRHHGVADPVIERAVARLRATPPLEMVKAYREAGL
jgi:hypothetical protein